MYCIARPAMPRLLHSMKRMGKATEKYSCIETIVKKITKIEKEGDAWVKGKMAARASLFLAPARMPRPLPTSAKITLPSPFAKRLPLYGVENCH